jgi:hypothetical protein
MLLGWPRRLGAKALPDKVRQTLISRFRLDDDQTTRLRYMEKRGHFAGRQVRFLRVFDPALIPSGSEKLPQAFNDLGAYRQAVLFEGQIEKDGIVHLVDNRPRGLSSQGAAPPVA